MKGLPAAVVPIAAIAALTALAAGRSTAAQPRAARVPVLAELFTSEGCSSCPPADELLRRLVAEQPIEGVEVIALSEHVDYWDRLGWRDPFSSPRFTARQQAYARALGSERIYTPQLVVNGREEVVGSDADAARRAFVHAARNAGATIEVSGAIAASVATIRVAVRDLPRDAKRNRLTVVAAIVEDDLASDVTRGENARRRLRHAAVARTIDAIGRLDGDSVSGEFVRDISVDGGWNRDHLRVIAFVQHPRTLHVVGAAAAPLHAPAR